MLSPFYSPGGMPSAGMFIPYSVSSTGSAYSYHQQYPFPLAPLIPTGYRPRFTNGVIGANLSGEGPPQLRKLFIGGLSHDTTDDQLRQYYSQWGAVVDCIVIRDPQTKYSRGFGFVTFATIQMAEAAMADRPHTINNKVVDPKRAIPREQMSPFMPNHPPPFLETEPNPGCKLSIAGIHWVYHTVDDLRKYFDTFGTVEQVEILGNPRGLGFVVFDSASSVEKCIQHGKMHVINGQECEVTRNPIEHSMYQRAGVCNDDDENEVEVEELVDSESISGLATPDDVTADILSEQIDKCNILEHHEVQGNSSEANAAAENAAVNNPGADICKEKNEKCFTNQKTVDKQSLKSEKKNKKSDKA